MSEDTRPDGTHAPGADGGRRAAADTDSTADTDTDSTADTAAGGAAAGAGAGDGSKYTPDGSHADEMARALGDVIDRLDRPPTRAEFAAADTGYTPGQLVGEFGSWTAAIEAAGGDPHERGLGVGEEDLLEALRELADAVDGVPTSSAMTARGRFSHAPYHRRWGGWAEALEAAGLVADADDYDPGRGPGRIDTDRLLDDLRAFADRVGGVPSRLLVEAHGPHAGTTYTDRFGSWAETLAAAGLVADADDYDPHAPEVVTQADVDTTADGAAAASGANATAG